MSNSPRYEPRYHAALPVSVRAGKAHVEGESANISFGGMLVHSASREITLRPRSLVEVAVLTPKEGVLRIPAEVVHVRSSWRGLAIGLKIFGLGGSDAIAWQHVLEAARSSHPLGPDSNTPIGQHFEPLVYRDAEQVAVLRVYFASIAPVEALAKEENAAAPRLFIMTDEPLSEKDEIGLQLCHPESEDIFELTAIVIRCVNQHAVNGVEVEIIDLNSERKKRLAEFVEDGMAELFDEAVVEPPQQSSRGRAL